MGVVSRKQWTVLIVAFLAVCLFFFYDMLFPRVQIVVFSDTAAADMDAVFREVDEDVSIRPERDGEAEEWEVGVRPTYLVLGYGFGPELKRVYRAKDRHWFQLHRTDDRDALIRYLRRDWNLLIWRWWLRG
jgi:hypothetical protein